MATLAHILISIGERFLLCLVYPYGKVIRLRVNAQYNLGVQKQDLVFLARVHVYGIAGIPDG